MNPLPVGITVQAASRLLRIDWDDGSTSCLPHALLRASCRCALCQRTARAGGLPGEGAAVSLTEVIPMADGGLNLAFSDGHARGIYPWAYLKELGGQAALAA